MAAATQPSSPRRAHCVAGRTLGYDLLFVLTVSARANMPAIMRGWRNCGLLAEGSLDPRSQGASAGTGDRRDVCFVCACPGASGSTNSTSEACSALVYCRRLCGQWAPTLPVPPLTLHDQAPIVQLQAALVQLLDLRAQHLAWGAFGTCKKQMRQARRCARRQRHRLRCSQQPAAQQPVVKALLTSSFVSSWASRSLWGKQQLNRDAMFRAPHARPG